MQNEPNFPDDQMNVNKVLTRDYENKTNWKVRKNEPNTNPIKANFRKAKMNVNSFITKDYRKKDDFAVQKNKPNSNPISKAKKCCEVRKGESTPGDRTSYLRPPLRIRCNRKGRVFDNIFSERLWRTVKVEEVYLQKITLELSYLKQALPVLSNTGYYPLVELPRCGQCSREAG